MNKNILKYWYIILEFLLFFLMLLVVPPVCDRWIESMAYEHGNILRYLWSEVYWISHANTRFLSNFLSYIVDNNIILHAMCNAIMLTSISIVSIILNRTINDKNKAIAATFSALCLTLVSRGIYKEVYFYAATLYLSSFLLICIILIINLKLAEGKATKKEKHLLLALIIIGCSWLESNIFPILALTGAIWLIKSLEFKKIDKVTASPFIISSICSFFMVAITYFIHGDGKLARSGGHIKFTVEPLVDLIKDNCFLFLILSFIVILNIKKYKKECHALNSATKDSIWSIHVIIWSIILVGNLVLCVKYIYEIIRTNPDDTLKQVYGWFSAQNDFLDAFFDIFIEISYITFPIFFILGAVSLIYIFYLTNKQLVGVPLLLLGCSETVIVIWGLYPGDRITSGFIFSLILLIAILVPNIATKDMSVVNKCWRGCFWGVCLMACISMYSIFIFLDTQNAVAHKRQMIAEEVKKQQAMGTWNYDSFVIMPVYCASPDGMELVGEARKNPVNRDAYYPFLLHYYGLEADTKILFSDDYALQIVKIIDNNGTAYLYANSLHEYENVQYKFQIIEESDIEDVDEFFIIADSEWQSENVWFIPQISLKDDNIKYKCYIRKNGIIIKEKECDAIPWYEKLP